MFLFLFFSFLCLFLFCLYFPEWRIDHRKPTPSTRVTINHHWTVYSCHKYYWFDNYRSFVRYIQVLFSPASSFFLFLLPFQAALLELISVCHINSPEPARTEIRSVHSRMHAQIESNPRKLAQVEINSRGCASYANWNQFFQFGLTKINSQLVQTVANSRRPKSIRVPCRWNQLSHACAS